MKDERDNGTTQIRRGGLASRTQGTESEAHVNTSDHGAPL